MGFMYWKITFRALNQSSKCGSCAIANDGFVLFLWWCETECLGTLAASGPVILAPDEWENGAIAELQISAETEILREKHVSVLSVYHRSQRNCPGIELVSCYGSTLEMNYIYHPTHKTPRVPFQELKQQSLKIKHSPLSAVEDCDTWRFSSSFRVRLRGKVRGQSDNY
jgi:hypothetical protein